MIWLREAALRLLCVVIGLLIVSGGQGADLQALKPIGKSAEVASEASVQVDVLDAALERAGMRREDLGVSPRGWWMRYPRAPRHKLAHFDDLFQEPLAVVPFARTLARAVRELLGPEGLATPDQRQRGHSLHDLVSIFIDRRYPAFPFLTKPRMAEKDVPLDEAILALYKYAGQPSHLATGFLGANVPDAGIDVEIRRRAAQLSPEVSGIMGRLVLDVVDAHHWGAMAFRDVPMEQRLQIAQRADMWKALELSEGLDYDHVRVFDEVAAKWDEASLWYAARKCVEALDRTRRALQALHPEKLNTPTFEWKTPLGWIRVFGTGDDEIDGTDSLLLVDLGGNDRWRGPVGASSPTQLISLALDLSGDDIYEGGAGTQGAGITGIGILLDAAGNDRYEAKSYAQGGAQFGFGALIDLGGNDVYHADHSAQGSAAFGVGLLLDAAGDDRYEILADGQGYGGPGGVGVLADRMGNDIYRAEPDARKSGRPSFGTEFSASAAQGVGVARCCFTASYGRFWAGGLGALIDIEGDDTYIAGNWSQGAGYWFGTGILYDGMGNDHYEGGSVTQAAAVHYAIGALLDEGGDDVHVIRGNGLAFAHDVGIALFVAIGGNDHYTILGPGTGNRYRSPLIDVPVSTASGEARDRSPLIGGPGFGYSRDRSPLALFVDIGGDDVYEAPAEPPPGFYKSRNDYHPGYALYEPGFAASADATGGITDPVGRLIPSFAYTSSLGIFLDVGGNDTYRGYIAKGDVWGDKPGSDNWIVRNVGVGMHVPEGSIDWRPLSFRSLRGSR